MCMNCSQAYAARQCQLKKGPKNVPKIGPEKGMGKMPIESMPLGLCDREESFLLKG